jgi:mono/diheme cytochrome c family protein
MLFAAVAGAGLYVTRPQALAAADLPAHDPDPANGAAVFSAGGCAGCHAAPGAPEDQRLVLSGGRAFVTAFGTFIAPNISPDAAAGIGDWTPAQFASALKFGTSPDGSHYYPAFPYTSYARMTVEDMLDLHAYILTLPASGNRPGPHDVGFPFNIRLSLGGWKLLFMRPDAVVPASDDPVAARGQYLVEGPGHCGECHTPRNALGGSDFSRWLGGGPNPDGPGRIPNITPAALTWEANDIAYYLETGFTPDFDSVGGSMAEVVRNISKLPPEDRQAIAAYLKTVPPVAPETAPAEPAPDTAPAAAATE